MRKLNNLKLVLFFVGLTVLLTIIVVYVWEMVLMSPLYNYVGAIPPEEKIKAEHWRVAQRIEHFFISITVDTIVVTLLLWRVNREQRRLRASDERYRALFEQASDGIGVVAVADHRVVDANDRFTDILGYEANNVIGAHVCDLFRVDGNSSIDEWPLPLSNCPGPGEPMRSVPESAKPVEIEVETASGKRLPISASCSTLMTGEEKLFILNIHDLSEHKQLEKIKEEMRSRFAQNERINALGRMAAQVAHEVKNPLAGLRLYSLHLKSKVEGKVDDKEMSLIDKIIGSINHLSDTVDKVLNFARPLNLARNRVDLNEIVTAAVQLLEPQLMANRIEMKLDLSESPLFSLLDEALIRATLINLMVNSIQAMPDGGSLTISTRDGQSYVHVTITDTGIGMTDEQIGSVFEPFYTTKSQGMGLGMSYAWKVIEHHEGKLKMESRVGQGTQIKISLPVKE